MRAALQLAFVDSVNLLLIGVIVAVGIVAPAVNRRYAKTVALLIVGDWVGVASLALLMLVIFDGLGPAVQHFVEGPVFGWVLVATGVVTGALAIRGGDNSALTARIMRPLDTPGPLTVVTGLILGLIQSATSVPFYGGLAVLSASGIEPAVRYASIPLYATVALSLPTLSALLVGWVRVKPDSAAGRGFAWARTHPQAVTLAATWAVAALLIVLGAAHLVS